MLEFSGSSVTTATTNSKNLKQSQTNATISLSSKLKDPITINEFIDSQNGKATASRHTPRTPQMRPETQLFIQLYTDMNEKAIESMNKDEPETSLEYLKKVNETLTRLEQGNNSSKQIGIVSSENSGAVGTINNNEYQIDPNYKATLYYNLATCYQRLGMLEECIDFLELATKQLNLKIIQLEEEENALLFQNTNNNSIEGEFDFVGNNQYTRQIQQLSTNSTSNEAKIKALAQSPNQPIVLSNNPSKQSQKQTRERLLAQKLHKLRYQCKFHLQLCALFSQINQHRDALIFGQKSSSLCTKLICESQLLCKRFMHQIQRALKRQQEKQLSKKGTIDGNLKQDSVQSLMTKAQANNYSFTQQKQGISRKGKSSRSSLNSMERIGGEKFAANQSKRSYSSQSEKNERRENSIVSNISSPSNSITRLRIYKNPLKKENVTVNESQSRQRDNSNESLERIHTFSLKTSFQNKNNQDQSSNRSESKPSSLIRQAMDQFRNAKETQSQEQSNKAYYVEESVKILQSIIQQADPILSELVSKVKQFEKVGKLSSKERELELIEKYGAEEFIEQKRKLKISFHSEDEIEALKSDNHYKMSVRNVLGLRHSEDWIFNLNIGNVMHLSLMGGEELNAKLENTHELCKDSMLEKIVLASVSLFCIGTEMRFLMQKQSSLFVKKDSEAFHAKALHLSTLFLPSDCPLVSHIVNSYKKNYLKDKKHVSSANKRTSNYNEHSNGKNRQSYGTSPSSHQSKKIHIQLNEQEQALTSIISRVGRGKHQQPTQQQQQMTLSNPRTSGSESNEDSSSQPHSIDAKAQKVIPSSINNQITSKPIVGNFSQMHHDFLSRQQPIKQIQSNRVHINLKNQEQIQKAQQLSNLYSSSPKVISGYQQNIFHPQQAFIQQNEQLNKSEQITAASNHQPSDVMIQRFIKQRPSITSQQQQNQSHQMPSQLQNQLLMNEFVKQNYQKFMDQNLINNRTHFQQNITSNFQPTNLNHQHTIVNQRTSKVKSSLSTTQHFNPTSQNIRLNLKTPALQQQIEKQVNHTAKRDSSDGKQKKATVKGQNRSNVQQNGVSSNILKTTAHVNF